MVGYLEYFILYIFEYLKSLRIPEDFLELGFSGVDMAAFGSLVVFGLFGRIVQEIQEHRPICFLFLLFVSLIGRIHIVIAISRFSFRIRPENIERFSSLEIVFDRLGFKG